MITIIVSILAPIVYLIIQYRMMKSENDFSLIFGFRAIGVSIISIILMLIWKVILLAIFSLVALILPTWLYWELFTYFDKRTPQIHHDELFNWFVGTWMITIFIPWIIGIVWVVSKYKNQEILLWLYDLPLII